MEVRCQYSEDDDSVSRQLEPSSGLELRLVYVPKVVVKI